MYAIECMVAYLDIELVPTQDVLKKMKQASQIISWRGDAQTQTEKALFSD